MRLLHTADWHIGKALRGRSRLDEQEQVLHEILEILVRERIDCLLVAGDIFDSHAPSADAERLVYQFFAELAGRRIPAVVIAGNHDHPERLHGLRPLLAPMRLYLAGRALPPQEGGVITLPVPGGPLRIALLPWIPEYKILRAESLMGSAVARAQDYSERMAQIVEALCGPDASNGAHILLGHLYVAGAQDSGSERAVHQAKPYDLAAQRFPPTLSYIALGHLHRPQEVFASSPARYSGSLLQLDFGEEGQDKQVFLVEIQHPGRPARAEAIRLAKGRRLRTLRRDLGALQREAHQLANGDWLRIELAIEKPQPGLADRLRQLLPNAVEISLHLPATEAQEPPPSAHLSPVELFAAFYQEKRGAQPAPELIQLFKELHETHSAGN